MKLAKSNLFASSDFPLSFFSLFSTLVSSEDENVFLTESLQYRLPNAKIGYARDIIVEKLKTCTTNERFFVKTTKP